MFRITIYGEGKAPEENEVEAFEDAEDMALSCLGDLEIDAISGFTVSKIKNPWGSHGRQ